MKDKQICQHQCTEVTSIILQGDLSAGQEGTVDAEAAGSGEGLLGVWVVFVFHSDITRLLRVI